MELASYFAIARRWWLVVLASVVFAAVGGYAVASQLPRIYEAEVRVLVGPLNTDLNTQRAAGQLANTYAQLVTSDRITDAVIRRLQLGTRSSDLQEAMRAVPNDVTRLVVIRVQDGDPTMAARLANAVAEELAVLSAAANRPEGTILVIDPADAPATPVAPQVPTIVLLAAFAGLVVAISGVVLIEYMRDSLASEDQLRELAAAPMLGRLATHFGPKQDFASALLDSKLGGSYRAMTARIERSMTSDKRRALLVTGVRSDGTAGVVAAGLALAFADRGFSTGLVDGNVEHPAATQAMGLESVRDLGTMIAGGWIPISRLTLVGGEEPSGEARNVELAVVPSGTGRDMGKLRDLEMVLESLRASAEIVVITAPPIDRSPEALLWAGLVDAVVMVVPLSGTRRGEVSSTVEALRLAGLQLAGTIVTESPSRAPRLRLRGPGSAAGAFQHRVAVDVVAAPRVVRASRSRPATRTHE